MPKRIPDVNLEWYVFYENVNAREIVELNVFRHSTFLDRCRDAARKCGDDRAVFADMVRSALLYHFWCKCEYEIILTSWPWREGDPERKVDVFQQVMMNFDRFIDYLWGNLAYLKKRQRKK